MNIIPRCLDLSSKHPVYENLPETFSAINAYLASNPLEGWLGLLSICMIEGFLEIFVDHVST